ncbi:hypothetical protein Sme01_44310 [Sphaerisporangium melleum]|uniref:Uncharacterized protein n=1 Tax=Sphaerisporangium melleum TaxID=321316 RepID=A0A917R0B6_9ACTN|nr:hypothetical protein [Sphaerisporangium melleum]GGK81168.1 hypothetical protein GCM10007964_24800 [Sphaerisporangium melleum]GII71955.1 hypothetical protein Sme01_44310 [Sphaerisporangium melleum]
MSLSPPRALSSSLTWSRGLLRAHPLFAAVLVLAAGLRVVTMLGYPPAQLYWYDSFSYLDVATHPRPSLGFHPSGYPLLLWLLRPFHSVEVIVGLQHAMGLGIGVLIYAVLRRRGLPGWGASLAAVPGLFDASFLRLEHGVLSDTLFIFLVVAALAVLGWSPRPSVAACAAAGGLLALAALTRTIALPLLVLVLVYLAARRVGVRRLAAAAVAGALPLLAYGGWNAQVNGRFALGGGDGVVLWARTMTFADCAVIRPPAAERPLCPNGAHQDAASEYVWDPAASLNRMPGGRDGNNDLARSFALRAIAAQPLDYLADVARDAAITFAWTPVRHPQRVTPAFGFARGAWGLPDYPLVEKVRREYDPDIRGLRSVEPWAGFLMVYQYPAYLRGPVIGLILLVGGLGAVAGRRRAALPWVAAMFLLVGPVAVLDFDHRYVLPVIPVACLAAALGAADLTAAARRRRRRGIAARAAGGTTTRQFAS